MRKETPQSLSVALGCIADDIRSAGLNDSPVHGLGLDGIARRIEYAADAVLSLATPADEPPAALDTLLDRWSACHRDGTTKDLQEPMAQQWEYRQFFGTELLTRLNDPGERWELATPLVTGTSSDDGHSAPWFSAIIRRPRQNGGAS